MTRLGTFSANARPEDVRECLLAYYRFRDVAAEMAAEYVSERAPLGDRVALALVREEIEDGIASARRWLTKRARRGVPVDLSAVALSASSMGGRKAVSTGAGASAVAAGPCTESLAAGAPQVDVMVGGAP